MHGQFLMEADLFSKDINRKKFETKKRKERENKQRKDIREREHVRGFRGGA